MQYKIIDYSSIKGLYTAADGEWLTMWANDRNTDGYTFCKCMDS